MSGEKKNSLGKMASGVLLVLLIVGLAGFGATNFGGANTAIATVGDEEITVTDYGLALQSAIRAREAETEQSLSFIEAQNIGLPAVVRSQLIAEAALDNTVTGMGLSIGDEEVRRQVLAYPAFQGIDGQFDRESYRFSLEQIGLSESEFEEQIRTDTARSILQSAVASGVPHSVQSVDAMFNYMSARRSYNLFTLTADNLSSEISEPTDAELQTYYEENAAAFTVPEAREITYVWITPDMIVDQVEVDETLLRELYDQRIDEFVQPERRLVERLVFPDQAAADDAAARLESGEASFDDLVTERGLELGDVDLGDVGVDDLGAAASAVFGMAEPGTTGPHASDFGPAIFRMNAVLAAQEVTFEDARSDLSLEVSLDQATRIIADMTLEIDDQLAAGATLEELAKDTDMELGQIAFHEGVTDGIAAYNNFRETAVELRESDFPELADLEDGGIFAARLNGIAPPNLQPLQDVRDEAIEGWTREETVRLLQEEAIAIKAKLEAGENAISVGYPVELFEGLTRSGVSPLILSEDLFAAEIGNILIKADGDQVYVVQLKEILPPDTEDTSTALLRQLWEQQSAQSLTQDLFSMFSQSLLNDAELSLNQAAIEAVHTQFVQ
ncbi:peptidyl-prolyl cis-trans isomerase [Actibacterium pelagium]|uniref:Peptidyl-prolyl cis-trans isomerase n=1 Tax=Actibacterium pelagium TaxID=2029103 RepID=A0A917ABS7_9RHOB|nr:peptidyl-prolyl cis-trans isomerase [Actibacterium pelagium]GGE41796.1 peptidyl-prolyl cis-trans isomerase [Actibacterium pelagium]